MTYNDFQILNNDEYNFINSHYQSLQMFNRKNTLLTICNQINTCKSFCMGLDKAYNKRINNALNLTFNLLDKNLNNLLSTFTLNISNISEVKNVNIFSFLKQLIILNQTLTNWLTNETKEYYKTIAVNSIKEISSTLEEILTALASSTIQTYKHM